MKDHVDQSKVTRKALIQYGVNQIDEVVNALMIVVPLLAPGLYTAKSLVGYAMVRHQEELNQLVEFIRDNPGAFRSEIVESEEFQDAFVLHLESYVRLRSEEKRFVARQVLLGLAKARDKRQFPLERLQDTLAKISEISLEFIAFVEAEIVPLRHAHIEKQVDESNLDASDKPRDWWIADHEKSRAISKDIDIHLYEMYNPNSDKVKMRLNAGNDLEGETLSQAFEVERLEREKIYDSISELTQLGVMASSPRIESWSGGGGRDYRFTKFGFVFIEYVKDSNFLTLTD